MNNLHNKKSPFDILGVGQYSTQKEIRRAYLELCKKHHPDIAASTATATVDFREITVAYELLSNSKKNNRAVASAGGVDWEQVKQRNINTKIWTRNSYFIGFGITALMIIYLSLDKNKRDKTRIILPHERIITSSNDDINTTKTPWQTEGLSFREWRKK
jgi:hypothetical protein